jgi:phosphatidylcholine synthase
MPTFFTSRARAYAVHVLTASGVAAAFLAVAELFDDAPDERVVFVWLAVAVVIDAVDGPIARVWEVKRFAPDIDGRTIDDIVDYLTFTFIPLLLVWRMGWVPFAPAFLVPCG